MSPGKLESPLPSSDFFEVMRTACAVRRYRDLPVPKEVLVACLRAATWAPSGSNAQQWRFCVLDDPEIRKLVADAYRQGWRDLQAVQGVNYAADDVSPKARTARTMEFFVEHIEAAPALVLFCFRDHRSGRSSSSYVSPEFMIGGSIFPAVQNFVLAARAAGLGTVITSWFRYREKELRELIGIPDDYALAALLPVGYPVGHHHPVRRRPLEEVTCMDQWDSQFLVHESKTAS